MKLIVFEGYNDLQFFRSLLRKIMDARVVTPREKDLIENFKNLVYTNPESARVELLEINNEKVLLLSTGGKQNFKYIAKGLRPLIINLRRKKNENLNKILFIADADASDEVEKSLKSVGNIIREHPDFNIEIDKILYNTHLEDVIIQTINLIMEKFDSEIKNLIESVVKEINHHFRGDNYLKKRKISIYHAFIGPRCFGHLYDEIFQRYGDTEDLTYGVDIFGRLIEWLSD